MKEYSLSLDIISTELSLQDLTAQAWRHSVRELS
jgi:hypothetical protein